jgi:hypothetical protein
MCLASSTRWNSSACDDGQERAVAPVSPISLLQQAPPLPRASGLSIIHKSQHSARRGAKTHGTQSFSGRQVLNRVSGWTCKAVGCGGLQAGAPHGKGEEFSRTDLSVRQRQAHPMSVLTPRRIVEPINRFVGGGVATVGYSVLKDYVAHGYVGRTADAVLSVAALASRCHGPGEICIMVRASARGERRGETKGWLWRRFLRLACFSRLLPCPGLQPGVSGEERLRAGAFPAAFRRKRDSPVPADAVKHKRPCAMESVAGVPRSRTDFAEQNRSERTGTKTCLQTIQLS